MNTIQPENEAQDTTPSELPPTEESHHSGWMKTFGGGLVSGAVLVMAILFFAPDKNDTPTTTTTVTSVPSQETVAQVTTVEDSVGRPLPTLSPNVPPSWIQNKPAPVSKSVSLRAAPVASTPTVATAPAKVVEAEREFIPNPPYTRPSYGPDDWASESLFPSSPKPSKD